VHLTNTLFVARQNYTKKKRGGGAEGKWLEKVIT
jgi:hypothetical protein